MVHWLVSANGRSLAALAALSALAACAISPAETPAETPGAGWQVIERVGQARYSPPDGAGWLSVITGRPIVDGSEVVTGRGGRLIVAMPGRHISVGPASNFVLPSPDWGNRLEQRAGWLRYRVVSAGGGPFRVHTRSLDLEFAEAVLDVRVELDAIDVTVKEGEVRLATPDGLRRTEIAAGQSAQASGPGGAQLAVRRAPEGGLQPVEPLIIPAVQPTPAVTVAPVTDRPPMAQDPAEPETAVLPSAINQPVYGRTPRLLAGAEASELAPADAAPATAQRAPSATQPERATSRAPAARSGSGTTGASSEQVQRRPAATARATESSRPSSGRRGQFERLTAGMLDGVQPPVPSRIQP